MSGITSSDPTQAAFEAWAADHLGQGYPLTKDEGTYECAVTRWAFKAWKAALSMKLDGFAYFVQPGGFGPFIECSPQQPGSFIAYRAIPSQCAAGRRDLTCPGCGTDRMKSPCPRMQNECAMVADAHLIAADPSAPA